MPAFGPEIADRVLAACRTGAAEAAAALGRALGGNYSLATPEAPTVFPLPSPPGGWSGAGLIFVVSTSGGNAALAIPALEGITPPWCPQPDESGTSRLLTLAQELGINLLPEEFFPDQCAAHWVTDVNAALASSGVAAGASVLSLPLSKEEAASVLTIVWPVANPAALASFAPKAPPAAEPVPPVSVASSHATAATKPASRDRIHYDRIEEAVTYLPPYSRSLLKIKVPVRVTLASTRLPVRQIVELAPGSIIQFQKSCDEMLELEVGQHAVAQGEAVKVGEKFGLRITGMILPGERFIPLGRKPQA